ncbi:hypothetical protein WJ969_22775 [Achromobacter xylosoxidans]
MPIYRAPRVEAAPLNRPGLALPPRAAQAQRRTPEFSLGFAGDDLLLVDRGMVFVYRGFAAQGEAVAIEPALLYTAPPQRRPVSDRSAVIQTPDGHACVLCRGQLLRWRDGQLHPLALRYPDAASGISRIPSPAATAPSPGSKTMRFATRTWTPLPSAAMRRNRCPPAA